MTKTRLEAFSDGVIAIIITIMVLEMKIPHTDKLEHLLSLLPVFLSYLLSFVFIGIYWGNHHHLIHVVKKVTPGIIWANLNLLFWLSLIPFVTGWMGENGFSTQPVALYGVVLVFAAIAYFILQQTIISGHTFSAKMTEAMNKQKIKGMISLAGYMASVPLAFIHAGISAGIFIAIAILWLIPDRNIERALEE